MGPRRDVERDVERAVDTDVGAEIDVDADVAADVDVNVDQVDIAVEGGGPVRAEPSEAADIDEGLAEASEEAVE